MRKTSFLIAAFLSLGLLPQARAQQSSQQSSDGSTTPAAKPAAQKAPAKPNTSTTSKKPKKVWTNDDIPSSPEPDPNAVVLPPDPNALAPNTTVGPMPKKDVIANFRRRLAALHAQLNATDQKITELRNFKAENSSPSGGIDPHHGYSMTPIPDQIRQLEEKKKAIQASIDDLEDQARKSGIEPGDLR